MSELARELVQQALDQDYNGANKIFDNNSYIHICFRMLHW